MAGVAKAEATLWSQERKVRNLLNTKIKIPNEFHLLRGNMHGFLQARYYGGFLWLGRGPRQGPFPLEELNRFELSWELDSHALRQPIVSCLASIFRVQFS